MTRIERIDSIFASGFIASAAGNSVAAQTYWAIAQALWRDLRDEAKVGD